MIHYDLNIIAESNLLFNLFYFNERTYLFLILTLAVPLIQTRLESLFTHPPF